jgi:hypothetical protein
LDSSFGLDFSRVKVHTGEESNRLNKALNADAFTVGRDVFFSKGAYNPTSKQGQKLLAHELTHVIQQQGDRASGSMRIARYPRDYANFLFEEHADESYPRLHIRGLDETQLVEPLPLRLEEAFELHDTGFDPVTSVIREDWQVVITETSEPEGVQTMSLRYEDSEGRFFLRAWRVGEEPVEDPELWARDRLEALLDRYSTGAWHISMLQSSIAEGSIRFIRARSRSETPRLGGRYPTAPSLEPMADPYEGLARQMLITVMRERLTEVAIPTPSGELGMRLNQEFGGYAYRARAYTQGRFEHEASREHMDYLSNLELAGIGLDSSDLRVGALWRLFRGIWVHEGDPSAINAYDSEIVTLGAGFSGATDARDMGRILNMLPSAYHNHLYACGILVNEDNTLTVLDFVRGVVEQNDNALRILQVDTQRLGLLIRLAQSQQQMSHEGLTLSARAWMVRSQFIRFMERNSDVPTTILTNWDAVPLRFAFKLKHWAGGLHWSRMAATRGDINAIANYVLQRIYDLKHDEWSIAYIQGRIRQIARLAGVTQEIVFRRVREVEPAAATTDTPPAAEEPTTTLEPLD